MEGHAAQHLVPAAVPQRDIAQSYHAAGLLTEQSGLYMRKLEERINRSGLWRPDVPHFIDKIGGEPRPRSGPFVVGCVAHLS
jgi:hypothetical protein